MTDMITKLNTAIAVLNDTKKSVAKCSQAAQKVGYNTPNVPKEDSVESISRRLVVVRGMLNQINRELKGGK